MTYVPNELYERVCDQARHRCGYCLTAEEIIGMPMDLEHLIPQSIDGPTEEANLWLACSRCNVYKSDRIVATDPETGEVVPLFDPRRQSWGEHFRWSEQGDEIIGLTEIGRATVAALQLNRELLVKARRLWISVGWHPPPE